MIPWSWLIAAFTVGGLVGMFLMIWGLTRYRGFRIEVNWKGW